MTSEETVTISRAEYDALVAHNAELKEYIAALQADDGSRIPHPVALAVIRGDSPLSAFRKHRGLTLRQLAESSGVTASYISEIERGIKPGSMSALARLANALNTTIDALAIDSEG
ncbi:MAG: helix-turn-helix transcriptional regulator [Chloroflexi bacterium]|nr:helix-turn-helix transcriptional regulator [Chloroflexota bacterium]